MAPEYSWVKIGNKYKTIFLNKSLTQIEYQDDGISKNNIKHRVSSPKNTCEVYKYYLEISSSLNMTLRCMINFNRFALHGGANLKISLLGLLTLPLSYLLYSYDKFKL